MASELHREAVSAGSIICKYDSEPLICRDTDSSDGVDNLYKFSELELVLAGDFSESFKPRLKRQRFL